MTKHRWSRLVGIGTIALYCLCFGMAVGFVTESSAQNAQEDIEEVRQEYADRLQRSRLIGPPNDLAIELPNGELISIGRGNGCAPPVLRAGVVQVNCTAFDGPTYYFDESTGAMIEACSLWFPEPKRCPPRRWPIEVSECDGTVPRDIVDTWRLYAVPGATGFHPTDGGWTMTLGEGTMTFDFYGVAEAERSYAVVARDGPHFSLELRDSSSETTTIELQLAPCGLLVEADAVCNAFCENIARDAGTPTDEQLREIIANSLGNEADPATLEQILRSIPNEAARRQQQPQPLFPERAYFRRASDR